MQPSQPVTWLILTRLNITTANNNTKQLEKPCKKLSKNAQTKANETDLRPFMPSGEETDQAAPSIHVGHDTT